MATAKRLPSGSYRVRVYSHTDGNGRKVYESFTAATKKEAEMKAAQWANKKERQNRISLTVKEAVSRYINAKSGVLSPSTLRGYDKILRNNLSLIADKQIKKLTSEDLQMFVSSLAVNLSAKSVYNIYGLVSSALSFFDPDSKYKVTLPARKKTKQESPSDDDIASLFNAASPILKKCIALAAYGSLRRGEICALTFADIKDNFIIVSKDIVQDKNGKWIEKDIPKTSESFREAPIPDKVVSLLGNGNPDEKIIKYRNPGSITQCFTKLRNRMGINVRFHDLRHYYASIGAILGIPDNYLSDFGGWKRGSGVMKEVYQNSIKNKSDEYAKKISSHFNDLL